MSNTGQLRKEFEGAYTQLDMYDRQTNALQPMYSIAGALKSLLTNDMRTWVQLVCGVASGSLDLFDLLLNNDFFVCHRDYSMLLISKSLHLDLFEKCMALSIATEIDTVSSSQQSGQHAPDNTARSELGLGCDTLLSKSLNESTSPCYLKIYAELGIDPCYSTVIWPDLTGS